MIFSNFLKDYYNISIDKLLSYDNERRLAIYDTYVSLLLATEENDEAEEKIWLVGTTSILDSTCVYNIRVRAKSRQVAERIYRKYVILYGEGTDQRCWCEVGDNSLKSKIEYLKSLGYPILYSEDLGNTIKCDYSDVDVNAGNTYLIGVKSIRFSFKRMYSSIRLVKASNRERAVSIYLDNMSNVITTDELDRVVIIDGIGYFEGTVFKDTLQLREAKQHDVLVSNK